MTNIQGSVQACPPRHARGTHKPLSSAQSRAQECESPLEHGGRTGLIGGTRCWTAGFLPVKLRRGDAECGGARLSLGSSRLFAARGSKHAAREDNNRVIGGV